MKAPKNINRSSSVNKEEIRKKLQWFHGEDFSKYPFIEAQTH